MTATGFDAPWETTTPLMLRSCSEGVIQLSPLSFYAVLEFVEISHACFVHFVLQYSPTHFSQLNLNPANLEATVEIVRWSRSNICYFGHSNPLLIDWLSRGGMNSDVSILAKIAFFNDVTITSSLRSVVQVLMGYFTLFQSHGLSGWFMPKIV